MLIVVRIPSWLTAVALTFLRSYADPVEGVVTAASINVSLRILYD